MEGAAVEFEHGETSKAPLPAPAGSGINRDITVMEGAAVEFEHGETSKAPLPAPAGSGINRDITVMEGAAVEFEHGETSKAPLPAPAGSGINRVLSVVDIVLRFIAIGGTAGSAIAMGTTNEALPFFTPFVQFRAEYSDLPSLTFFVVANTVVCAYLVLSLPVSVVHAFRPRARYSLAILVFFDAVMLALLMAGAAAAAAIVYLAHRGNALANWFAICQQFSSFCERISRSLIGSFAAVVLLLVLVFLSALALALARRG